MDECKPLVSGPGGLHAGARGERVRPAGVGKDVRPAEVGKDVKSRPPSRENVRAAGAYTRPLLRST